MSGFLLAFLSEGIETEPGNGYKVRPVQGDQRQVVYERRGSNDGIRHAETDALAALFRDQVARPVGNLAVRVVDDKAGQELFGRIPFPRPPCRRALQAA